MFEGPAEFWWKSEQRLLLQGRTDANAKIGWEKFLKFYDQYFNERFRSMGVSQYEAKFTILSRFAPHLIATKVLRVKKFGKGLNFKIREGLTTTQNQDYKNLVALVEAMEEDVQESARIRTTMEQGIGKTIKYNQPWKGKFSPNSSKSSGGATLWSGCSQEHPDLKKKNLYIIIKFFLFVYS